MKHLISICRVVERLFAIIQIRNIVVARTTGFHLVTHTVPPAADPASVYHLASVWNARAVEAGVGSVADPAIVYHLASVWNVLAVEAVVGSVADPASVSSACAGGFWKGAALAGSPIAVRFV